MFLRALATLMVATACALLVYTFRPHLTWPPPRIAPRPAAADSSKKVDAEPLTDDASARGTEGSSRIVALAAAYSHTCVALRGGSAKCWGSNSHGELGIDPSAVRDVPYEPVGTGRYPHPMCLGPGEAATGFGISRHSICVALASGRVKCFGASVAGLLGDSGASPAGLCGDLGDSVAAVDLGARQHALEVVSGATHQCALLATGRVKCWGSNGYGQLGLGDLRSRGDTPHSMGDNLPFVDLGSGRTARRLSAGLAFTCALLDDGHVKCWGRGDRLGLGSTSNRGGAPGQMGDDLPPVNLGAGRLAVSLASGPVATCAILDTGEIKCWGLACGAMGSCDQDATGDEPDEMGDALAPLALGTKARATALAVGMNGACALLDEHSLRCWGRNVDGELGLGDWRAHGCGGMGGALPSVDVGPGRSVRRVAVGFGYTCVVLDSDELKCWGWQGLAAADMPWPDRFVPMRVPPVEFGD